MSDLRPPQHPIPVVVFTGSGLVRGLLPVPVVKDLQGFLNTGEEILNLTEAVLPGGNQVHPAFLALRKSAVILIVAMEGHDPQRSDPGQTPRELRLVTCLLTQGSIRGYLDTPVNTRTSDFLRLNPGFLRLKDCHLGPNPYLDPLEADGDPIPLVLVNGQCLVGVVDEVEAGHKAGGFAIQWAQEG